MKKFFALIFIISAAVMLPANRASAFSSLTENEFMTGESLDPGMTQAGINYTVGEHYVSYYPEIRYGMGALMELGVRFGATSARLASGENIGALMGADLKYQLAKETEGIPIDLAVDLGLDNTIINSKNASELTFATIASKGLPLTDRGYKITPYGGLAMSALYGSLPDKQDSYVNAFAGLEWKLTQKFMILLEFKAGHEMTGGAGIRFEY